MTTPNAQSVEGLRELVKAVVALRSSQENLMHRPDLPNQIPPLPQKGSDLFGLLRMISGNNQQLINLSAPQGKRVRMWDYPAVHHCPVSVQCLAGEDDALVGFLWCHGGTLCPY